MVQISSQIVKLEDLVQLAVVHIFNKLRYMILFDADCVFARCA